MSIFALILTRPLHGNVVVVIDRAQMAKEIFLLTSGRAANSYKKRNERRGGLVLLFTSTSTSLTRYYVVMNSIFKLASNVKTSIFLIFEDIKEVWYGSFGYPL
jgi:hypothetical protein